MQRVVAAGADDEMRGVLRRDLELEPDGGGDRAVHGVQRGARAGGKAPVQLLDHIGAVADIGAVGEDRVAEKDDVLRRVGGFRRGPGDGQ